MRHEMPPEGWPDVEPKSLTMYALESHVMTPPEFSEKVAPVKSALELTNARIPGP